MNGMRLGVACDRWGIDLFLDIVLILMCGRHIASAVGQSSTLRVIRE